MIILIIVRVILPEILLTIPSIIQQTEVQNENLMLQQKGTVKVAVLYGDPDSKQMIAISYYDSNLFISCPLL